MSDADKPLSARLFEHPLAKITIALVIAAIGILALRHLSGEVSWQDIITDIAAYKLPTLMLALGLTLVSFTAVACYDVFAVASFAPGKVPMQTAAATGASSYALSNLLGFSWLTGGALRFRVYVALGVSWSLVIGIITASWAAFWVATLLVLGTLMIVFPTGLLHGLTHTPAMEITIGFGILLAVSVWFTLLARGIRSLGYRKFRLILPSTALAFSQTIIGLFDVAGAALTLYVLLPPDISQNATLFFAIYALAVALGILSHAPGGIGVFEATMVAGLGAGGRSDVLAALTIYRVTYYFLPFSIAALGSLVALVRMRRARK